MATFAKVILSGSTNGRGIEITGISPSTANTIHTAVTGAGDYHEIYLYAVNTQNTNSDYIIVWGVTAANATGAGVTARRFQGRITRDDGPVLVGPGWPLNGGNIIEAYATAAGRIVIYGYAHTRVS